MPTFAYKLAAECPEEIALRDENRALKWAEVDDILNRVANGLAQLDLGPKRRVAVFAENAAETALANLGGLIGSASVVPVNFHLTADELAYILDDADVRVLFADGNTLDRAVEAARVANVPMVIAWQAESPDAIAWEAWLAEQPADPADEGLPPRPNLLYTSGTTGRPKGTELPPNSFAGGETVAEHLANFANDPLAALGLHLVVGPMYHAGPLAGARLLAAGVCSVILGDFDAEKTLSAIDEYKAGNTVMVPTHFIRLLALPDEIKAKYDLSSLLFVGHTGSKCPVDIKRAMIEWFGPVLVDGYGATESGSCCMIDSNEWLRHPGSVGKAVDPYTAMILDDDGNELRPNQEGRLFFRDKTGRGIVYHNAPEKTAEAHIAPGVFTLGEIGYMNDEGYVFITDRFSDMVVSGGVNIYPAEAEQVLIEHPAILDVACIGVPHPDMGESLKALAIAKDQAVDAEEILTWCQERLSRYKCPRTLDWVEDLGRNTMGKINKRALRAPYWKESA